MEMSGVTSSCVFGVSVQAHPLVFMQDLLLITYITENMGMTISALINRNWFLCGSLTISKLIKYFDPNQYFASNPYVCGKYLSNKQDHVHPTDCYRKIKPFRVIKTSLHHVE